MLRTSGGEKGGLAFSARAKTFVCEHGEFGVRELAKCALRATIAR
jgi:hypothetical protein